MTPVSSHTCAYHYPTHDMSPDQLFLWPVLASERNKVAWQGDNSIHVNIIHTYIQTLRIIDWIGLRVESVRKEELYLIQPFHKLFSLLFSNVLKKLSILFTLGAFGPCLILETFRNWPSRAGGCKTVSIFPLSI